MVSVIDTNWGADGGGGAKPANIIHTVDYRRSPPTRSSAESISIWLPIPAKRDPINASYANVATLISIRASTPSSDTRLKEIVDEVRYLVNTYAITGVNVQFVEKEQDMSDRHRQIFIYELTVQCIQNMVASTATTYTGVLAGSLYVLRDGTLPLTANWDVGAFSITASKYISNIAVGTQPYACTSTTKNTNLNADLWDGYEFADWMDQAVKAASAPSFAHIHLTVADGTIPIEVTSTTMCTNLNAEHWGGYHTSAFVDGKLTRYSAASTRLETGTVAESAGALSAITSVSMSAGLSTPTSITMNGAISGATNIGMNGTLGTVSTLTITGAIATATNISMTTELDMTGTGAIIDLNPSGTASTNIIDITPSAAIAAASAWTGIRIATGSLDPLAGAVTTVQGMDINLAGTASANGNATLKGFVVDGSATDLQFDFECLPVAKTNATNYTSFETYLPYALGQTQTNYGLRVEWSAATRSANAPVLIGVSSELPASYTNFGTCYAGYFSGASKVVQLCDAANAITTTGTIVSSDYIQSTNGTFRSGNTHGILNANGAGAAMYFTDDVVDHSASCGGATAVSVHQGYYVHVWAASNPSRKENILDADSIELERQFDSLRVKSFNWRDDRTMTTYLGILATEAPDFVRKDADDGTPEAVNYDAIDMLLVNKVKLLEERIAKLEAAK
jgi:hypothetical protein